MKYLEQRVADLEKKVQELEVKLIQKEFKETKHDYMYNYSNMTLLSETKSEADFPPYPDVWGSWEPIHNLIDSSNIPPYYPPANSEDVIKENTDDFDKMDKDYLEWLNKNPYKDSSNKNSKI